MSSHGGAVPVGETDPLGGAGTDGPDAVSLAEAMTEALGAGGVVGMAVTVVDNSGVVRVKGIPVARLADATERGIGAPVVFDAFGIDDSIAPVGSPVGDLRLLPDLDAVVTLAGQPGWSWAPADRVEVDGSPYAGCQRSFARRMQERAATAGYEVTMAFETEFVLDAGADTELVAVTTAPAYSMSRLIDLSGFGRDLLEAFATEGVEVEQLHPEYAASQLELSVAPRPPVAAADRVVLVRQTIRAVAANHGYRVSFSPAVAPGGVGSGAHVHLSVWRDGVNLLAEGPHGLDRVGEAWLAGILDALPALVAVVAPSAASYLRLQPQRWAAPWRAWGRENREAAMRLVAGSSSSGAGANVELKVVDASANPYLVVGALIAAGLDGVGRSLRLPPEATGDPAALDDEARAAAGITRLPASLSEALDAFDSSSVPRAAMGPELAGTWTSVRRAEADRFAAASEEDIALASRWVW
jgi:glutamine synthetase